MTPPPPLTPPIPQRWERPLNVPPGFWKQQLPGKYLSIAAKGDIFELRKLLKAHPEFLSKLGNHNRTLLWEATRSGRMAAVQFLVEQGADVNATGCYNSESHVQITPYCAARYYRRDEVAAYLWSRGSQVDVFRAAFLGDRERVVRLLDADPSLLNQEDPFDNIYFIPLLSFAVTGGHADLAEFLIGRGAAVAQYSAQLLYLAARVPRMDLIQLLVTHGADMSAVDTSIFLSIPDLDVVRYLLNHGASARRVSKNGFPPLIYLARGDKREDPDKIKVLLDHGAQVNAVGPKGRTALHYAAAGGHAKVVALLLEHDARTGLKDDGGRTALDLARAAGKTSVVELLARHGTKR